MMSPCSEDSRVSNARPRAPGTRLLVCLFGGLAGWTPIEGAPGQVLAFDERGVHETRLVVAAVDVVDLLRLGLAFWVGPVFGTGGHDAAVHHAIAHQLHCVAPQSV